MHAKAELKQLKKNIETEVAKMRKAIKKEADASLGKLGKSSIGKNLDQFADEVDFLIEQLVNKFNPVVDSFSTQLQKRKDKFTGSLHKKQAKVVAKRARKVTRSTKKSSKKKRSLRF